MAWNLPDGCTDYDVDVAAGGYDEPKCECRYDSDSDSMDRSCCWIHADASEALLPARRIDRALEPREDHCPF